MKKAGQVILFKFPRGNLSRGKLRPALILSKMPGSYSVWMICMISSKTEQKVDGFDEIVAKVDDDFIETGLKTDSLIRLGRLAVVNDNILEGIIGKISPERLKRLKINLANWLVSEKD